MAIKRRGTQARRKPGRRVPVPVAPEFRHQPFEALVAMALDGLAPGVRKLLDNVAVVIDDEPTPDQLTGSSLRPTDTLYGLYEGVPPLEYGAGYAQFPNKITIFRLPLEHDFPNPEELAFEVQRTVLHELGHHAGITDVHLREIGF